MSAGGQAAIAASLGLILVMYWQLMMWLHASAFYMVLLGLLGITALCAALLFRGAKLLEFVAGSWQHQRYRARLFGVVCEGEHGQLLLRHLMGLAHDEARGRGFLGTVCTTLDDGGDDQSGGGGSRDRQAAGLNTVTPEQARPALAAPKAGRGSAVGAVEAEALLSTAAAFPPRSNRAPMLLVAKGESFVPRPASR